MKSYKHKRIAKRTSIEIFLIKNMKGTEKHSRKKLINSINTTNIPFSLLSQILRFKRWSPQNLGNMFHRTVFSCGLNTREHSTKVRLFKNFEIVHSDCQLEIFRRNFLRQIWILFSVITSRGSVISSKVNAKKEKKCCNKINHSGNRKLF